MMMTKTCKKIKHFFKTLSKPVAKDKGETKFANHNLNEVERPFSNGDGDGTWGDVIPCDDLPKL